MDATENVDYSTDIKIKIVAPRDEALKIVFLSLLIVSYKVRYGMLWKYFVVEGKLIILLLLITKIKPTHMTEIGE